MKPSFFQKAVVTALMAVMLATAAPVAAPRAHALFGVGDTTFNFTVGDLQRWLEFALRRAAIIAANVAIQSMTRSIVTWINSGFEGSPAWETNLGVHLRQIGDAVAYDVLNQVVAHTELSGNTDRIVGTIWAGYLLYTSRDSLAYRIRYSLERFTYNATGFYAGGFGNGGFNAWMATTWQCGNDPYCTEFAIQDDLFRRQEEAQGRILNELGWGRGFLSVKKCTNEETGSTTVKLSDADTNQDCEATTLGTLAADSMGFVATQPLLRATVADSLDQVLAALAGQLIGQIFSPDGLLGAGNGSRRSNIRSLNPGSVNPSIASSIEQSILNDRSQIDDYRSAWITVRDAASSAVNACVIRGVNFGGNSPDRQFAQEVLTQANAAIDRATTGMQRLETLASEVQAATRTNAGARTRSVDIISDEYNCLVSGRNYNLEATDPDAACVNPPEGSIGTTCPVGQSTLPSSAEVVCILRESQDTKDATTQSLYTRLTSISGSCL